MTDKSPATLTRISVSTVDAMLGLPFKVLDGGFVRVVDYMGSDASIVRAARVSYGTGTRRVRDDRALIRYLMRHRHTTPFEMCELQLHVRVPMDTWRQWIRHRTANVNEYSTRYSVAIDEAMRTLPGEWRRQSAINKQGSGGLLPSDAGAMLSAAEESFHDSARRIYEQRLLEGVAREQARKDLPLSTYTEAYWKIDLHNLFHFLELRLSSRAQHEIREYANVIGWRIVKEWCPVAWEAFQDYRLSGLKLSATEVELVGHMVRGEQRLALDVAKQAGWLDTKGKPRREAQEVDAKLGKLGMTAPWKTSKGPEG